MSSGMHAVVRATRLARRSMAAALIDVEAICAAGEQSPEVQASPLCLFALAELKAAVVAARAAYTAYLDAIKAARAATEALHSAFRVVESSIRVYERSIEGLAHADPAIITRAGLLARDVAPPAAALGEMTTPAGKPGRLEAEVLLSWPAVKGARGYAVELSFTPESPDAPWTPLLLGSRLRRVIKAPSRRAQVLVRVAAVNAHGVQSAWSPPILVTAR